MKLSILGIAISLIGVIASGASILLVAAAADKNPKDPNLEERKAEVVLMVEELKTKDKQLQKKIYNGTIEQVITQRLNDVNSTYELAKNTNEKAVKVCEDMNVKATKQDAVDKVLKSKKEKLGVMQMHNDLILWTHEIMSDPNIQPGPNDPNYTSEMESNQWFLAAIMEACSPR
jgi:hypothetical protein